MSAQAASPLQTTCMASSVQVECPLNNNNTARLPRMTQADSVQCQVCSVNASIDWDVRPDNFWVSIGFGPNMGANGYYENFDQYRVMMVDEMGMVLGEATTANSRATVIPIHQPAGATCCPGGAYRINLKGAIPAGMTHFMIVPANTAADFYVPLGRMIAFTDIKEGPVVTTISGKFVFQVGNPAELKANPHAVKILEKSIAKSLKGVEESMVTVNDIKVARRLSENMRRLEEKRRLAGSIQVDYTIIIPPGSPLAAMGMNAISKDSFNATTLSAAIESEAAKVGLTVSVSDVVVSEVQATALTPTGDEPITGAASSMAGGVLCALLLAIATLTGRQSIA